MSTPTISTLPAAPTRTMTAAAFVTAADAFVAALATFVAEANILAADVNNTNINASASALAQASSAATSAALALTRANTATTAAAAAAASAETARAIVGVPPAFEGLITQPNQIPSDVTIPDGYNALMIGDFELSPDATITCLGNSTFLAIG
jgi:hypothetical protein